MQKILFFSHYPTLTGIDGANNMLMRLITFMPADKYDILVIVPDEGLLFKELKSKNINVVKMDYDCSYFNDIIFGGNVDRNNIDGICRNMETALAQTDIYQLFQAWKPDIVFVNTAMAINGAILGKMIGAKVIWYIHDISSQFLTSEDNNNLNAIINRYSDKIIVVGKAVKNALGEAGSSPKCELNYIGVPGPDWSIEEVHHKGLIIRQDLSIKANSPVIGYLGRISAEKGLEKIFEAAVMILRHYPDAKFIIAGNVNPNAINYYEKLIDLIKTLSLSNSVQFVGYYSNISDILPAIDCLVIPSIYEEPLAAVGIEANLFYKPVVSFNVGGISEAIVHLRNGLLVRKNDMLDMCRSIQLLLRNKDVSRQMGYFGCKRAHNKFGYSRFKNSMIEIIDEVANGQFIGKPYRSGDFVMDSKSNIYFIKDGAKQIIESPQRLLAMGIDMATDIKQIEDYILDTLPIYNGEIDVKV